MGIAASSPPLEILSAARPIGLGGPELEALWQLTETTQRYIPATTTLHYVLGVFKSRIEFEIVRSNFDMPKSAFDDMKADMFGIYRYLSAPGEDKGTYTYVQRPIYDACTETYADVRCILIAFSAVIQATKEHATMRGDTVVRTPSLQVNGCQLELDAPS